MTRELRAERRAERERLIELARTYIDRLSMRIEVRAAIVAGSVARGDFNVWSDVDVIVVADELPERRPDRGMVLALDAPGRVQPVGYTPSELARARLRGDRLVVEGLESGVVLRGAACLSRLEPGPETA